MPSQDRTAATVGSVELSGTEADTLRGSLSAVTGDPYRDFEDFLHQVESARPALPAHAVGALRTMRRHEGPGSLLLRGLPVPDAVPDTPLAPFLSTAMEPVGTEGLLVAIASRLGEPFSYAQWDGGHLIHNKYPIRAHRDVQFGSNAVEFLLHTETPFRDVSPDFLTLLCVRGDPAGLARTRVAPIAGVVARLPPDRREVLRRPLFAFETDTPVRVVDGRGLTEPQPVLTEADGRPLIEYVDDLLGIDAAAREVLALMRERLAAEAVDVALTAGDMLVLDNFRVVHGRNAIEPRYDGTDRWLQRSLLTHRLLTPGGGRLVEDRRYANYPTDYRAVLNAAP
jgi:L-asparagine oxygenase